MKLRLATAVGAITLVLGAAAHSQTNLLVNGGFETGLASWTTTGFALQGYDYGIDDDAHSGASAFYGGAIDGLGFLRQSITSVTGQAYSVDFWLASDGYLPNHFQVLANGEALLDAEDVLLQPYSAMHVSFTASSTSTQLAFGFRNDSGALHLDSVTVTAVPEPTTGVLLAIGLCAISVGRRRFSRAAPEGIVPRAAGL